MNTSHESEKFDLNFGLSGVTKQVSHKKMELPSGGNIDPSECKIEAKLPTLVQTSSLDNLIINLLRPEIKDLSVLSPHVFREKIKELRQFIQKQRSTNTPDRELYDKIDTILEQEENKSELLDQYRRTLLLG